LEFVYLKKDAVEVDRHGAVPFFGRDGLDVAERNDACVVDDGIELPEEL